MPLLLILPPKLLKYVYGRGTGAECRKLVQSLNFTSGELEEQEKEKAAITEISNKDGFIVIGAEEENEEQELTFVSKWTDFIDQPADAATDEPQSEQFDGKENRHFVTERPEVRKGERTWPSRKRQKVQGGRGRSYHEDEYGNEEPEFFHSNRDVTMPASCEYSTATSSSRIGGVIHSQRSNNGSIREFKDRTITESENNNHYHRLPSNTRKKSLGESTKLLSEDKILGERELVNHGNYNKKDNSLLRNKFSSHTTFQTEEQCIRSDRSVSDQGKRTQMKPQVIKYSKEHSKSSKWSLFLETEEETDPCQEAGSLQEDHTLNDSGNLYSQAENFTTEREVSSCTNVESIFRVPVETEEDYSWVD
ncbi:hypothetical protein BSL78_25054 [Apostichopus japonicus]|uniref:Uncharacterized protein n=1 Tax=Stichopus japonicus TaxID=307972 RepID=A0A2G8JQR4_STIJA|nr:hypothetical protein BSL78_25054 [Apostichopus japonicus]